MKKVILLLLFLIIIAPVVAHQPRIVTEEVTVVKDPEISQAFYGELDGPNYYNISEDESFNLYLNLLVPDIENIDKDLSLEVTKDNETILALNGSEYEWTYFYEEYGGDGYYKGPEAERKVEAGTYIVKVFSPDNQGKYVLAVGKEEKFEVKDMFDTLVTLPKLKKDFFGKSSFTAFNNRIGLFLLIPIIIFVGLIFLIYFLMRWRKKYLFKS